MMDSPTTMTYDMLQHPAIVQSISSNVANALVYLAMPQGKKFAQQQETSTSKYTPLSWGIDYAELLLKLDRIASEPSLTPKGAPMPETRTINLARIIIDRFREISVIPDKVVATSEGGVAVCLTAGDKYADIECLNRGATLGVTTNRRTRPIVWEIGETEFDISSACSRIKKFVGRRTWQTKA